MARADIADESNVLHYIDNPGFEDTKCYLQEINTVYSIHSALYTNKKGSKAKMLIVIPACDIGASRSKEIQEFLAKFDSIFPNLTESEKKAVVLVITCEEMGKPPSAYINELNQKDSSGITKKWCEYFLNHQEQLFTIPAAKEDMNGQTFDFEDKNKFFKEDQYINPNPKLSLSEDSKFILDNDQINDIAHPFFWGFF